jgi:hypothetical protein
MLSSRERRRRAAPRTMKGNDMRMSKMGAGLVLGAAAALLVSQVCSQESGQSPDDMQKAMADWMATTRPGEHHKKLEGSIGTWEATTKMWMGGPGGEPVVTRGRAERKWVLGGRFMQEDFSSEMMMPDPASGEMKAVPWQGMGLFGFDNHRKTYVGCWADTMGTQLLTMKGTVDPSGKVFTYYGEMDEPMLGVVGRMVKYTTRIIDADTQVFEIYDLHAGDDYKVVEVTYKRSGAARAKSPAR